MKLIPYGSRAGSTISRMDPRIRSLIQTKMKWIHITAFQIFQQLGILNSLYRCTKCVHCTIMASLALTSHFVPFLVPSTWARSSWPSFSSTAPRPSPTNSGKQNKKYHQVCIYIFFYHITKEAEGVKAVKLIKRSSIEIIIFEHLKNIERNDDF